MPEYEHEHRREFILVYSLRITIITMSAVISVEQLGQILGRVNLDLPWAVDHPMLIDAWGRCFAS